MKPRSEPRQEAVAEFAQRWADRLKVLAGKVPCQCLPIRVGTEEMDHLDPDCPVAVTLREVRLMQQEAAEAVEAAQDD